MSTEYRELVTQCKKLQNENWHEEQCSGRGINKDTIRNTVHDALRRRNNWEANSIAGLLKDGSSSPRLAARTPPPPPPALAMSAPVVSTTLHPTRSPARVPMSLDNSSVASDASSNGASIVLHSPVAMAKEEIKTDEITTDATPSHREEAAVDGPFPTLLRFSREALVSALIAEQNVLKSAFGTHNVDSKERKRELELLDSVFNLPKGTLETQLMRRG